jgi:hypothetical protein
LIDAKLLVDLERSLLSSEQRTVGGRQGVEAAP